MSDVFVSKYRDFPVVAAYLDNSLEYLSVIHSSNLSNIYLCRVQNVVKNINAAFLGYGNNETGYIKFSDILPEAIINRKAEDSNSVRQGDEILAQLETESIKTKKPKFTTMISISGRYSVVTLGRRGVGASVKLSDGVRKRLIETVSETYQELSDEYRSSLSGCSFGVIVRTECSDLSEEDAGDVIATDIRAILEKIKAVLSQARTRTAGSCLYEVDSLDLDRHIQQASKFLKEKGAADFKILDQSVVYSVKDDIEGLLKNRIWLKSGAYIVIEQLESFNAIDVNTGKAISGKKDITKAINFEAAKEIFRQIRLRNLSGMILIDFINMKRSEDKEELCNFVRELARKETVHTEFIDMTGLGIIELIRTKTDRSLREILSDNNRLHD